MAVPMKNGSHPAQQTTRVIMVVVVMVVIVLMFVPVSTSMLVSCVMGMSRLSGWGLGSM